jgi:hypothetical protein
MRTKLLISTLAGGMVFSMAGCGTMNVTTLGSPDHHNDPGQLVLLRITFGDDPAPTHYAGHRASERAAMQSEEVLLAGAAY